MVLPRRDRRERGDDETHRAGSQIRGHRDSRGESFFRRNRRPRPELRPGDETSSPGLRVVRPTGAVRFQCG